MAGTSAAARNNPPDVDDRDDDDDADKDKDKDNEDEESEPSRPEPRRFSATAPRTSMRSSSASSNEASEAGSISRINDIIGKHRRDDYAYVAVTRIKPPQINGVDATGWTMKMSLDTIQNADDLVDRISRHCGGLVYDLRFYGCKDGVEGTHYVGYSRLKINVPARLPPSPDDGTQSNQNNNQTVVHPDAKITEGTFTLLKGMIEDFRNGKGMGANNNTEMMKLVNDIVNAQTGPAMDGYKQTIDFQRKEIESLRNKMDEVITKGPGGSPEMLRWASEKATDSVVQVQKEWQNERALWQQERSNMLQAAEVSKQAAIEKYTQQLEKLTEKLEESQNKLRDAQDRSSQERQTREQSFNETAKHRDEMHQRDVESMRREKDNEVKRITDQLTGDIKRLNDQLAEERRSTEKVRESLEMNLRTQRESFELNMRTQREGYELNSKTQLERQEGIFKERIEGLNAQIKLADERFRDLEKRLDEKVRDLEKQRDDLNRQLVTEKTAPRPDAMEQTKTMIGTVTSIAAALGMKKDDGGGGRDPEPEIVALMRGAKEAGIVDGVKGIVSQVASAIALRPAAQQPAQQQQQQPQIVYMQQPQQTQYMPVQQMPQGYVQVQPTSQQVPQQMAPQTAPVQQQQQQQQQQQAPAQPAQQQQQAQVSEQELGAWKMVIQEFEQMLEEGKKPAEVSEKVRDSVPMVILRNIIASGVPEFMTLVKAVCSHRTENPDSPLLTPRGESWLRDVFSITGKAIA